MNNDSVYIVIVYCYIVIYMCFQKYNIYIQIINNVYKKQNKK